MNPENALVSRSIAHETDDKVTIIEVWNTLHPESPFIVIPWISQGPIINPHIRAIRMKRAEYNDAKIPLKATQQYQKEDTR